MRHEIAGDQTEVFAFLADPRSYRRDDPLPPPAKIERIDTHGAVVFLAGADVYKVKRAVRYPFMDFSTLEKRRAACEREIAVNRRNAPTLYLETLPVRRDAEGLHLGGDRGTIIEWAVHLRRFDETQTFDRLADRGALDLSLMAPLAEAIAAAHEAAPPGKDEDPTRLLRLRLDDTLDGLAAAEDLFPREETKRLRENFCARFDAVRPILEARARSGQVRLCHGDLHLRNIVLYDGRPLLFDAIEFDDSLATCDILYDFAFVLMDLWQRGLKLHASRLFNLYLWRIKDGEAVLGGLAALPLFLALRAAVRARVTAALCQLDANETTVRTAEAQHFFAAARDFLKPMPPRLVAVGGLSGSGKSSFARELAACLGTAPGAVHLRSDIERKRLFHVGRHEKLPEDAYRPEVTAHVYAEVRRLAEITLRAGHSVIVDAVHGRPEERDALAEVAARAHASFAGFWLDAPAETLVARVDGRANDASDAGAEIVRRQLGWDLGPIDWMKLDATKPLSALRDQALDALEG